MHNRLGLLRKDRGLSRQDLAGAVGVNPQTIGSIERGDYGPSLELGLRIAAYFGVRVEILFSLTPFPPLGAQLSERSGPSGDTNR
jgi:putative transcriptional regulator